MMVPKPRSRINVHCASIRSHCFYDEFKSMIYLFNLAAFLLDVNENIGML